MVIENKIDITCINDLFPNSRIITEVGTIQETRQIKLSQMKEKYTI